MGRDAGFAIADIDTGLFADPKVVALARRLRDPVQTAAHVGLYLALVLESWGTGERVTFDAAVPAWWLEPVDEIRRNLAEVGLIDDEGRITEHAWESWFLPAWNRREERRQSGQRGGLAKGRKLRSGDAVAQLEDSSGDAVPDPSVPTVPSDPLPLRPTRARRHLEDAREEEAAAAAPFMGIVVPSVLDGTNDDLVAAVAAGQMTDAEARAQMRERYHAEVIEAQEARLNRRAGRAT